MSGSLGWIPIDDWFVELSDGCDWGVDFVAPRGITFPVGTVATLVFGAVSGNGPTWTSIPLTLPQRELSIRATAAQTTAAIIPDRTLYDVYLSVPLDGGGTRKTHWFTGEARRHDRKA